MYVDHHSGKMMLKRISRKAVVAPVLAVTLGLGLCPAVAPVAYAESSAEISSQLDEARAKLDDLSKQLEIAQAGVDATEIELTDVQDRIDTLTQDIESTKEQLAAAQSTLSDHLANSYKEGDTSLLSVVLSASSFDELFSRVYYANKIAVDENEKIDEVTKLKADLESQQSELSSRKDELSDLLESQKSNQEALASSQQDAEDYVNSLSADLQTQLEAERQAAAEAQRKAAEEAAAAAAAAAQNSAASEPAAEQPASNGGGAGGNTQPSGGTGGGQTQQPSGGSGSSGTTRPSTGGGSTGGGSSSASGGLSSAARSTIVSAATSQLGVAYQLGACSPGVAMDCSGLSSYAYSCAGYSIPRSSSAQYNRVVSLGHLKSSTGALSVGDLVFYQSGGRIYHVAVYIGGGQVCHANGYGQGVVITGVTYDDGFCGGGSPV